MPVMPEDRFAERSRAIEAALLNIEKRFGKGSIMRLGERDVSDVPAISTTSLSLDAAIGIGGVPRGRIVEIYGPESSGKSTLAMHIVAQAQLAGGVAAYIDAEHAMDAEYAAKLGVKIDDMLISQPDSGEQALEIAEALVRSNGVDVIVVDSVAALVPRAELDGEMGDSLPGLQARLMSQALRKLTAIVAQSNTCFIFINQIREKIGVMFGNPETTSGGRALKFYSSLRLFQPAPRHSPHRRDQRRRSRGRQSHEGEGGQEQSRAAVPRSRVRHHVRRRHLARRRSAGSGDEQSDS